MNKFTSVEVHCACHEVAIILKSGKEKTCPACGQPRLWWFAVVKGKQSGFIAMMKKEPFVMDEPDAIREPGELWFALGNTQEKAFARLIAEDLALPEISNSTNAAATVSGLYNCQVCGLEKCAAPGICADCLVPPASTEEKAYSTKALIERLNNALENGYEKLGETDIGDLLLESELETLAKKKVCHVCHGEGVVTENGRLRTCVFC